MARKLLKQFSASLTGIVKIFDLLGIEIKEAISECHSFLAKPVFIPKDTELDEEIIQAIQNKAVGKSPFGFSGLIEKSAAKKKLEEIRVLGSSPESEEDWRHVKAYVGLQKRFRELITRWNSIASEKGSTRVAPRNFRELRTPHKPAVCVVGARGFEPLTR